MVIAYNEKLFISKHYTLWYDFNPFVAVEISRPSEVLCVASSLLNTICTWLVFSSPKNANFSIPFYKFSREKIFKEHVFGLLSYFKLLKTMSDLLLAEGNLCSWF